MRHSTSPRNDDSLQFTCPQCLAWLKARPSTGGTQQRCPRCQLVFEVPQETQTRVRGELYPVQPVGASAATGESPGISVTCPVCRTRIHGVVEQIGQTVQCPDCGTSVAIPPPPPASSQPIAPPRVVEEYTLHIEAPIVTGSVAGNESLIRLNCLLCGTMMYATADQVGRALVCPDCGTSTVVPRPPERPSQKEGVLADEIGEYELADEVDRSRGAPRAADQHYIPVVCSLCHTRMMAALDQVGTRMICPDCGTATAVPPPPPRRREIDVMAGAGRGYRSVPPPPPPPPVVDQQHEPPQDDRRLEPRPERPVLLRWPFLVGTFSFPLSAGARAQATVVAVWEMLGSWLTSEAVQLAAGSDARAMFLGAMFGAGAFMLAVMWFVFASACALAVVRDTAYGCDQVQDWPGLAFIDWMGDSLYMVVSLCVSLLPGVGLVWLLAGYDRQAILAIPASLFLLFPVVLLSTLECGSPLGAISLPVYRTMRKAGRGWAAFYLTSAVLLAAAGFASAAALSVAEPWGTIAASLIFAAAWFIYFRLLGRLAWYCAEKSIREEPQDE